LCQAFYRLLAPSFSKTKWWLAAYLARFLQMQNVVILDVPRFFDPMLLQQRETRETGENHGPQIYASVFCNRSYTLTAVEICSCTNASPHFHIAKS
jgi:hypothetical protein